MYLRVFRYRLAPIKAQQAASTRTTPRAVAFTTSHSKRTQQSGDTQPRGQHQPSDGSRSNGQRSQRLGPIRPITLFAVCIPLGYALNWAVKDQKEDGNAADGFVKYRLASKEDISSTCSIFTLRPETPSPIDISDPSFERFITSVQFKQPQLQIARNYTLLPRKESEDPQELRFLIRQERNGEVSGYLHRLPIGAEIEVRGVFSEYKLPAKLDKVVFLAGGTGIAPAMQGADILAGETEVHILWASRRREDCLGGVSNGRMAMSGNWSIWSWWQSKPMTSAPLEKGAIVSELDRLKQAAGLSAGQSREPRLFVDYFVDEEGSFIQSSDVQRLLRLENTQTAEEESSSKKILFVSGPDGFINHWAAPKQWKDGDEVQGRLGGVLSTLDLTGWKVVKL